MGSQVLQRPMPQLWKRFIHCKPSLEGVWRLELVCISDQNLSKTVTTTSEPLALSSCARANCMFLHRHTLQCLTCRTPQQSDADIIAKHACFQAFNTKICLQRPCVTVNSNGCQTAQAYKLQVETQAVQLKLNGTPTVC